MSIFEEYKKEMLKFEKYKKNKHFISFTQNSMSENEEVLNVLKAYQDISYVFSGLLFCTNQKVCFHRKGIVGNTTRSILIKNISSIDLDRFGISNINSKFVFNQLSNDKIIIFCDNLNEGQPSFEDTKRFKLFVENIREENQEHSKQNIEDPFEKIKKLKQLKDEGIITDLEFEEKKKTLMDKI